MSWKTDYQSMDYSTEEEQSFYWVMLKVKNKTNKASYSILKNLHFSFALQQLVSNTGIILSGKTKSAKLLLD